MKECREKCSAAGEFSPAARRLSKNHKLAAVARKQRFAGLRGKCCGTRLRGSAPITPAGTVGKRVPGGHNRHRRLATRRRDTKRAGTTAVAPATIEWQQCLLHLHFFDTLSAAGEFSPAARPFILSTIKALSTSLLKALFDAAFCFEETGATAPSVYR